MRFVLITYLIFFIYYFLPYFKAILLIIKSVDLSGEVVYNYSCKVKSGGEW